MHTTAPTRPARQVPIVVASSALSSLVTVRRAVAHALANFGTPVFFVIGVATATTGVNAPWFVLAAVLVGLALRAVEIESWALFIPGGLPGRVDEAYGPTAAATASAALLLERLLSTALACVVIGHYASVLGVTVIAGLKLERHITPDGLATLVAVSLLGVLWIRARLGRPNNADATARDIWTAVAALAVIALGGVIAVTMTPGALWRATPTLPSWGRFQGIDQAAAWAQPLLIAAACLAGLGYAAPAMGSGEGLAHVAAELPQPRIEGLRRTAFLVAAYALFVTASLSFFFAMLVPPTAQGLWVDAPLLGLTQHVPAPAWLRPFLTSGAALGAALMLGRSVQIGMTDAENTLLRMAQRGAVSEAFRVAHPRFGTYSRAIDAAAAAIILCILTSGGRTAWLARAYVAALVCTHVLRAAAVARLRAKRAGPSPFRVPFTLRLGDRERPIGLWAIALLVGGSGVGMLLVGDGATLAGAAALVALAGTCTLSQRRAQRTADAEEPEKFQLLPSRELSLDQVEARPGNVMVAVRHPYSLAHVSAAIEAAGGRDLVAMTVRLIGVDVEPDGAGDARPTPAERELFAEVLAIAERYGRPMRLLIVSGRDVSDAVIAAAGRLSTSEIYIGESTTLTADAQARLLGDAFERAQREGPQDIRLIVYRRSGRTDSFHLGAHAPALVQKDYELIHQLWLDAAKAVGPHVHHHDVVRAALMQMAEKLTGPERDEALVAVRRAAKPADELAAVLRSRDFSQLRDMVRNRQPGDLAALLTDLAIEDQVIVFRLMPRKDAAAVFEYLSHDAQETLLRAMAQEDVAALLNNMAPDDRTMFLEELPATVTRQLLALLTPDERSVALTLLGYPDGSIGRLMTPHYVAVREEWSVQQVLDYVRTHGRDSETLNVIYVVDEQGRLIDDIRIREFLLTDVAHHVAELMDRQFAALKAADDQETAVATFRRYDRTALPVTDSAGVLIGIVTVDDVLDVAEAAATKEIQKIGGSEALDEPYMRIAFGRMIQKRAGWLTALFIGEMATATAMGAFEQEIQRAVVLALFVPLIISSGGNSGSQASTLVIRALALGEVGLLDWWRVMRRELAAGLALGGILGSIGFLRISLWSAFSDVYGEHWLLVALTVSVSLVGIVMWGTLIGSLLPFLLRRLGFDPATSSAPFVATLVDVTGLVIYFTVATVILRGTLL